MTFNSDNRRVGFWLMDNAGISQDTVIYHYFDIEYLIQMLDNGSFHVSRKKVFEDPMERELLKRKLFFAFSIVGDNAPCQDSSLIQERINSSRARFSLLSSTLTSCWAQGPNENILLWKYYTKPSFGVCIKTTIGKFVEALNDDCYEMWCGKMLYENRGQTTDLNDAEWMKPPEFAGENEIRFYFKKNDLAPFELDKKTDDAFLGVDFRVLIDEIRLSPYMSKEEILIWQKYIAETYKINENKIIKSKSEIL